MELVIASLLILSGIGYFQKCIESSLMEQNLKASAHFAVGAFYIGCSAYVLWI